MLQKVHKFNHVRDCERPHRTAYLPSRVPCPNGKAKHLLTAAAAAATATVLSILYVALATSSLNMWTLGVMRTLIRTNEGPPAPQRHHAIIVPYRNRTYHLAQFKESLGPYLHRNFPNDSFTLWVVEQADDRLFNRAWLANVGITEALRLENRTRCIAFHDVDLIPESDGVPYNCCRLPTQLGSELEHFDWSVPYVNSFGGVVVMHANHWRRVNGFSNDYVGWGGEDDDLFERVRVNGLLDRQTNSVHRPPKGKGRFRTISQSAGHHPEGVIGEKEYAHSLHILEAMRQNSDRWRSDGLSNVHYRIVDCTVDKSVQGFIAVVHIKTQ